MKSILLLTFLFGSILGIYATGENQIPIYDKTTIQSSGNYQVLFPSSPYFGYNIMRINVDGNADAVMHMVDNFNNGKISNTTIGDTITTLESWYGFRAVISSKIVIQDGQIQSSIIFVYDDLGQYVYQLTRDPNLGVFMLESVVGGVNSLPISNLNFAI